MDQQEREIALQEMQALSSAFYSRAVRIGVHPFIEFCGLMNEYIKCCQQAHIDGIDFSECSKHADRHLPMKNFQISYVNEKLECIFTGRSVVDSQILGATS